MSPDNKRRIKYFAILVLAVFIGYAIGRNTGNAVRVIDMTKGWDPKIRELLPEDDWMRKAQGVAIGHFGIYAPNKSDARTLRIYAPKLNQYIHINEGYVSVNMNIKKYDIISINNDTKRPEKSSRFISYDIYDDNGSVIGDIIDYGRDGQPDFKTLYGDGKSQKPKEFAVWYGGEWRTLIQKGKPYGLVIDGRFRRYHIKDNHVVLAD